jgi:hypothetical protein
MAKVFVSYRYKDDRVRQFPRAGLLNPTTVRSYVDVLDPLLTGYEHVYKGERDGQDLQQFTDETIESKLRERIFDSSITILLISPGMNKFGVPEREQWIPWEISYSLRTKTVGDRRSLPNSMLAVILPDRAGNYAYFVEPVCHTGCLTWKKGTFFEMIGNNMFNRKPSLRKIGSCGAGHSIHLDDDHSYMHPVIWDEFIKNPNKYIEIAKRANANIDHYDLKIQLT